MKRALHLILVFFLLSSILQASDSGTKLSVILNGNYFSNFDATFKSTFGKTKLFPEGKITCAIIGNLYAWGSFGTFPGKYTWTEWSNKGEPTPDVEGISTVRKRIISGGAGFIIGYIKENELAVKAEIGICSITDKMLSTWDKIATKVLIKTKTEKPTGIGFRANLGVAYGIYKRLFTELSISFMSASDTVDTKKVKLGGFQLSLGLGYKLF